ncbi:hypothetical protein mRhiFer1_009622 [Rhinolophus ferrumequinum]|uniref:Uncharacterized protein n=1 Tax=Rhinolophus ferrumequinum TaxID=59479 RepID=A0A7J7ZQN3_RHIFE|nr:hypothetical protein mRhiFer1_009622 [Rhinolophus ferrumequinum]
MALQLQTACLNSKPVVKPVEFVVVGQLEVTTHLVIGAYTVTHSNKLCYWYCMPSNTPEGKFPKDLESDQVPIKDQVPNDVVKRNKDKLLAQSFCSHMENGPRKPLAALFAGRICWNVLANCLGLFSASCQSSAMNKRQIEGRLWDGFRG